MGLSSFLTAFLPFLAAFPLDVSGPVLFNLHKGESKRAFENYMSHAKECGTHDFELLGQISKVLIEQGIDSKDPEVQLMAIFGAGIASSSDLLPILRKGIHSSDGKTQLVALSYLGELEDDTADSIIQEALSSPFLIVRLEALLILARKNHPAVLNHLDALALKVPDEVKSVFGQIAVHLDGIEAYRYLQKLLNDPDINVRTDTILAVANAGRDDFLPSLHVLANTTSPLLQEAAAAAFGTLKDQNAIGKLRTFAESKQESLKITALVALCELQDTSALEILKESAKSGSLCAISALGQLQEGGPILAKLLTHPERDVRINALLALLEQHDKSALSCLEEFLIEDGKDIGLWRMHSAGGGLNIWKTIPSAAQQEKKYPGIKEQTFSLREKMLMHSLEFEEADFLRIARLIFEKKQNELVPLLCVLLENKKSEGVITFLKEWQARAGAPLIRNYCTLALYRLKVEGPYEEQLIRWVKEQGGSQLIRFREDDKSKSSLSCAHILNPEETSRFLVEACQTLGSAQNTAGIELILHAIAYGNPKNRYALAGLLLRCTE